MIKKLITFLSIMSLMACVNVETPIRKTEEQLAITSIFIEDFNIDKSHTYAFIPLQPEDEGARYPKITAAINHFLAQYSIKQVSLDNKPEFLIGYTLTHADEQSAQQLSDKFGVDPGLPSLPNLDKGTMLVFVLDGESNNVLWRSAAQGFIFEGKSDEERQHRIKQLVHAIFTQLVNK